MNVRLIGVIAMCDSIAIFHTSWASLDVQMNAIMSAAWWQLLLQRWSGNKRGAAWALRLVIRQVMFY